MKKQLFIMTAMVSLLTASCSQDEPAASLPEAVNRQIGFTVTADKGSRAATNYENGTDINKITVSAWLTKDGELPGYGEPNTDNLNYFTNDVLVRQAGAGTFNYQTDARYWPQNGETLDFFAVVDQDHELINAPFSFTANSTKIPGLDGTIAQSKNAHEMPDLLYAVTFGQGWNKDHTNNYQQNVSFSFHHAFAKVLVTAQVKNNNMRVEITDMKIKGVRKEGQFYLPYISGEGENLVENPAHWVVPEKFTSLRCPSTRYSRENPLVIMPGEKKELVSDDKDLKEAMMVLPFDYNGRNGSGKVQTYIELTGYAYNLSTAGDFDEDTDALIYGTWKTVYDENGTPSREPVPYKMCIPVEFNWAMGTVNRYNIIFDCLNGGTTPTTPDPEDPEDPEDPDAPDYPDPNEPSLVRIGYEVEVQDWISGENNDEEFDKKHNPNPTGK